MIRDVAARAVRAEPHQWIEVASAVFARRVELGLTAQQVVDLAGRGLSVGVLSRIENAQQESYAVRTLTALCRALDWKSDGIERILDGRQPLTVEDARSGDDLEGQTPEWWERLERVEALLAELLAERDERRADDAMTPAERARRLSEHQWAETQRLRPPEGAGRERDREPGRDRAS